MLYISGNLQVDIMFKSFTIASKASILFGVLGTVALFVAWTNGRVPKAHAYHSAQELMEFRGAGLDLPMGGNTFFKASGECSGCHGRDSIQPYANAIPSNIPGADSIDVNPVDQWRSSMMGNSAKDPFWRAKVSHEVAVNPGHQAGLEDKCTSCHAPMGRYDKFLTGGGHYSIAEMAADPIALDGVSCLSCHMQGPDSAGLIFSGALKFDTNNVVYGPYDAENLFGAPMANFVGYDPVYGAHITRAGLCAGCHTLITETADLEGNLTGDHFVEQATYHEWLNSSFNTDADPENGVTCQGCHMPRLFEGVAISALYNFLVTNPDFHRSPYGLHQMVGGNSFMLKLLQQNIATLGLTASSAQFDSSITWTERLLQQNTLLLDATVVDRSAEVASIDVQLTNLAGHKFPSGYPARRAFVELHVLDASGNTLFRSGNWDPAYEVVGHDEDWEPHHDVITSPDQAQIYEMVLGDVNDNKTTVLERAKTPLKDNRLAPLGFSTSHLSYDTTVIAGVPATDIDFNRYANGTEGSGTDIVHYQVPMNGYTGLITIAAKVWYQPAPPGWMEEMFAFNTPEIDAFRTMYEAADGTPVLVKEVEIADLSVNVDDLRELGVRIFPNPVRDGLLRIEGITERITGIEVFDMKGASVAKFVPAGTRNWQLTLPQRGATYLVVVRTANRNFVERVVVL